MTSLFFIEPTEETFQSDFCVVTICIDYNGLREMYRDIASVAANNVFEIFSHSIDNIFLIKRLEAQRTPTVLCLEQFAGYPSRPVMSSLRRWWSSKKHFYGQKTYTRPHTRVDESVTYNRNNSDDDAAADDGDDDDDVDDIGYD